jgi:hypothetical protein
MRDVGFGSVVLGVLLLAFPLFADLVPFILLKPNIAQLAGAGFLMAGGVTLALSPR